MAAGDEAVGSTAAGAATGDADAGTGGAAAGTGGAVASESPRAEREASIRLARAEDRPSIEQLIERSVRELCKNDYAPAQIDAALGSAFGVDSQLIIDGTYFVVEDAGTLLAAGGWSFRRTLFGADARPGRAPEPLDPARDAARIRAFFVAPEQARRGIGRRLLARCEAEARARGFQSAELAATLTGERLYGALGYVPVQRFSHPLGPGLAIDFVNMRKRL